jgi:DNA replication protein DnaC
MPDRDSGTGKFHLLIGLGPAAAEKGYRGKYTLATRLVNKPRRQSKTCSLPWKKLGLALKT